MPARRLCHPCRRGVVFQDVGATNQHATHTAGTMAGDGGRSEDRGGTRRQWRGVLRQADIYSYVWDNTNNEPEEQKTAIQTQAIDVFNNSWGGSGGLGSYDTRSSQFDGVVQLYNNKFAIPAGKIIGLVKKKGLLKSSSPPGLSRASS